MVLRVGASVGHDRPTSRGFGWVVIVLRLEAGVGHDSPLSRLGLGHDRTNSMIQQTFRTTWKRTLLVSAFTPTSVEQSETHFVYRNESPKKIATASPNSPPSSIRSAVLSR